MRKLRFVVHPLSVHVGAPLLLSLIGLVGALLRVYVFQVNDGDYGIFSNLLWNFANGNGWRMSLYEGEPRVLFLADHLAWIAAPLSPVFLLFPSHYTLSVLHSLAFAATFFLTPVFVREVWKQNGRDDYLPPALFLLLTLALFRGFCGAWAFQSHMTTLVMPFLLAALVALHRRAFIWAVLFCFVVALAQERAAVAVFGVGMYAWLVTQNRRLGFVLCLLSAAYFFAAVKYIIPFFAGGGDYIYSGSIRPFYELHAKALFLFAFVAFWFFLPWVGRRAFWAGCSALPLLGLGLVSERQAMYGFAHQYQDLPTVFFLAASTFGLLHLLQTTWFARFSRRTVVSLACLCLLVSFVDSYTVSSRRMPLRFLRTCWPLESEIPRLNEALSSHFPLPPEVKIYASTGIGPRLSLHKYRYYLTPAMAGQHFDSSMVFVAPMHDMYPYQNQKSEILDLLSSNPSLKLSKQSPELLVFTSVDLLNEPTAK
ncbi:MAG: DUF2079 domain-containing protein [Proteobacteria bacterium]|nr:DUF2079 domain-containing protein [Cystobacterineae bacterium]MCL2258202.1 DUF2079 domain-containing protein [Cystobacterineae bacterium]MCL2315454.1 DUF2079 domain-containing protein [Pseudomonadota bacterium]